MIEVASLFPVFVSQNLDQLKEFYCGFFGFDAVFFDAEFYLHLVHPASGAQLGFLIPNHPSQPEFLHGLAQQGGMVISLEVADAERAFDSARNMDLSVVMPLKEESWGQIHFMVRDPQGFVIDVVEHIN